MHQHQRSDSIKHSLISPTQEAGVYEISGYRKMLVPENQFVECSWTGTLTLLSGTGPDNPVLLSYEWLSKSWNPETGEFFKHVLVNVSQPGTPTPQP